MIKKSNNELFFFIIFIIKVFVLFHPFIICHLFIFYLFIYQFIYLFIINKKIE